MSISNEMGPADIRACTGNNDGVFGGNGAWWLIILFLFAFAGGGWGNGWGGGGGVQENYVLTSDFAQVERKLDGIANGLCDGFYAQNTSLLNGFAGVNQGMAQGFANAELARTNGIMALTQQLNAMAATNAQCCCDTKAAIADLKYSGAVNTRDIIDNQNANYRALHDEIVANRMADKDAQISALTMQVNNLNLAASQARQNEYLVDRLGPKMPVAAYLTCNPNGGINYAVPVDNCGCNCGWNR